jgi:hypothetical protein
MFERAARNRQYAQSRALITGSSTATGVQGPIPTTEIRDGSINAIGHVQVMQGTVDDDKFITLDPDLIADAATGQSRSIEPRACYLPVYDETNSKMRLKQAILLAGALYGDFEDFPGSASENPGAAITNLECTGEGAAAASTGTSWTYAGTNGVKLTVIDRVRYDESDATPKIEVYGRHLIFDKNGQLYSVSAEFKYTLDQPVEGY